MNKTPSFMQRILSVWRRHQKTYFKNLIANGLPPFMEPLLFILALGFGLGRFISDMEGLSYVAFMAPAMMATSSFYTATFETTYGTFVRMEYQKTYQNILSTPVKFRDLYLGELLWCGTKGLMFSACVLLVISLFGLVQFPYALLTHFVGFINAIVFGIIGFFVTGFTKNINNFNLFFTGFLTPMFFFSGTFFPLKELPTLFQKIAYFLPLTHSVILMRSLANNIFQVNLLMHLVILCLLSLPFALYSYYKLKNRMIV
ncbi:ABC transporter permease [bacterium]|nr:ABC transporter permease [bacterium]